MAADANARVKAEGAGAIGRALLAGGISLAVLGSGFGFLGGEAFGQEQPPDSQIGAAAYTGTNGNDVIRGFDSPEEINALAGDDVVYARGADDAVFGEGGRDALYGGTGNDRLVGGAGQDTLRGGAGNDVINGSAEPARRADFIDCGTGVDTVRADALDRVDGSCEKVVRLAS